MTKFLEKLLNVLQSLINTNSSGGIKQTTTQLLDETEPPKVSVEVTTNKTKETAMGYSFGSRSRGRLDTCHPDMIAICEEVIKIYDFSVLEGLRTLEKQQEYFETGRSKLDGVNKKSKHQDDGSGKSRAIDIMPYKKGTNAFSGAEKDQRRFYYLAGLMKMAAEKLKSEGKITHSLRWGGDWDSDDVYTDQNFDDLPHFELV